MTGHSTSNFEVSEKNNSMRFRRKVRKDILIDVTMLLLLMLAFFLLTMMVI